MGTVAPGSLRPGERAEFGLKGPFGGILSEIPDHVIEQFAGFRDAVNVFFARGQAIVRQSYDPLTALPIPVNEAIVGIYDFFRADGDRVQIVVTPTRLLQWNGGSLDWTDIAGVFTGSATDLFSFAVVADQLAFCQGVDKVKLWDGVTPGFADAAAAAVPARYMAEVANHLLVGYTIEGGNAAPQRVRWTGAGDPTDWTSLNAGDEDLFNDLGPITGVISLYQSGWIAQQWGWVQAIPTGQGLNPFAFVKLITGKQKGNICPHSLSVFNEVMAPYVGKDNVYVFNGNTCEPIGDFPIQGSRSRMGARSRIFGELAAADLGKVHGFSTTSISGHPFNAYWLFIPGASTWVFNFDEFNWTRFSFDDNIISSGIFNRAGIIRIKDLIGTIEAQSWSPATLVATSPLDDFAWGTDNGEVLVSDFNSRSETPWSLQTGPMPFGDLRHEDSTSAVRIVIKDNAVGMVFTVEAENEKGFSQTKVVTIGAASGKMLVIIVTFPLVTGMFLTVTISGDPGQPVDISEITPLYIMANEYKTNVF